MKIHIRDYIAQRKAELDTFEADWYARMESNPENYDFDTETYGGWVEQEEAFTETLTVRRTYKQSQVSCCIVASPK